MFIRGKTVAERGRSEARIDIALEQYKTYAEMADRTSARRQTANAIFLTLNTSVLALIGALVQAELTISPWLFIGPVALLIGECLSWLAMLRTYRRMNSVKYQVIAEMESRLAETPWTREWEIYRPSESRWLSISRIEALVPVGFILAYVCGLLMAF